MRARSADVADQMAAFEIAKDTVFAEEKTTSPTWSLGSAGLKTEVPHNDAEGSGVKQSTPRATGSGGRGGHHVNLNPQGRLAVGVQDDGGLPGLINRNLNTATVSRKRRMGNSRIVHHVDASLTTLVPNPERGHCQQRLTEGEGPDRSQ